MSDWGAGRCDTCNQPAAGNRCDDCLARELTTIRTHTAVQGGPPA